MRASDPENDLASVVDAAVTEKLERLEAKRFAKTAKPRKHAGDVDSTPSSRYIPAPVRRTVYQRDRDYVVAPDDDGRYAFTNLPPGGYVLFSNGAEHAPSHGTAAGGNRPPQDTLC